MKCEYFIRGKARKEPFLGIEKVFCRVDVCPYGNQGLMNWDNEECKYCKEDGEVHKKGLVREIIEHEGVIKNLF